MMEIPALFIKSNVFKSVPGLLYLNSTSLNIHHINKLHQIPLYTEMDLAKGRKTPM